MSPNPNRSLVFAVLFSLYFSVACQLYSEWTYPLLSNQGIPVGTVDGGSH